MSGIITPDGKPALNVVPEIIGKRTVSAYIEDENGATDKESLSVTLQFANDPMGVPMLALFQHIEILTGRLAELEKLVEEKENG